MKQKSRRTFLVGDTKAAGAKKRSPYPPRDPLLDKPMFSRTVAFGDLLFLSGVGNHKLRSVEIATRNVIEEIEKSLVDAGSSLQKCIKVGVFLRDLKDYDSMNRAYQIYDWGDVPPVRTTVASAGIPGTSLIEIDVIAYI
ncbi:MAG: RidA family protein [Alphaproteobacteria bacterium]